MSKVLQYTCDECKKVELSENDFQKPPGWLSVAVCEQGPESEADLNVTVCSRACAAMQLRLHAETLDPEVT